MSELDKIINDGLFALALFILGGITHAAWHEPEVSIEFDHRVVSSSYDDGAKFPKCVEVKYDFPNIKRLVCYKLEVK